MTETVGEMEPQKSSSESCVQGEALRLEGKGEPRAGQGE